MVAKFAIERHQMATPIAPVPVCWPLSPSSETVTSDRASAACYRGVEDFRIMPIVVAEFEFCDVQRHIFFADFMEGADHTALEDRPEAFNGLGVHGPNNIFASSVVKSWGNSLPRCL
jgi:hypothetical protein